MEIRLTQHRFLTLKLAQSFRCHLRPPSTNRGKYRFHPYVTKGCVMKAYYADVIQVKVGDAEFYVSLQLDAA